MVSITDFSLWYFQQKIFTGIFFFYTRHAQILLDLRSSSDFRFKTFQNMYAGSNSSDMLDQFSITIFYSIFSAVHFLILFP